MHTRSAEIRNEEPKQRDPYRIGWRTRRGGRLKGVAVSGFCCRFIIQRGTKGTALTLCNLQPTFMSLSEKLILAWLCCSSALAFALFGIDKFLAGRSGERRVSEFHLILVAALGGWVGGLLGMLVFRHKTSKLSFKLKYAAAFVVFAVLVYGAFTLGERNF